MPVTETDLRAVLAERSSVLTSAPDTLASVRRRIAARRRRTTVGCAALAVAAAAVAVPSLVVGRGHPHPASTATRTPAPYESPAAFVNGGRLLAGGVLHRPDQSSLTFTFVPTSWQLTIDTECSDPWPASLTEVVTVNGHPAISGSCGGGVSGMFNGEAQFWTNLGVRLDQPSTVTVTLVAGQPPGGVLSASPVPDDGSVAAGVYERVSLDEYSYPPRPRVLETLDPVPGGVDARLGGANGEGTLTARTVAGETLVVTTVAPGVVTVAVGLWSHDPHVTGVDWRQVDVISSWDYKSRHSIVNLDPVGLAAAGLHAVSGDRLSVNVKASGFGDQAWTARLQGPG
jgi:hypothetical protein